MRKTSLLSFLAVLLLSVAAAAPPAGDARPYEALKGEAERFYQEKSFSRAHALYEEAAKLQLAPGEQRWVALRLADTAWRADAADPDNDGTVREAARKALETLAAAEGGHDALWAGANESLGDFFSTHPRYHDIGSAQRYYGAALDFWAGSDDLATARRRYLAIVWKLTAEGNYAPRETLVNAVKIAETPEDRDHARVLLARQYMAEQTPASLERAAELLELVVRDGKKSEWYDDALMGWALVLTQGQDEAGADYVKALELYRRLVSEFRASETEYYDEATQAIAQITAVQADVATGATMLPESEQEYVVSWRNVKQVALALTAVDLSRDVTPDDRGTWLENIAIEGRTPVRTWTYETHDDGRHRPGMARLRLNPRVPPGAYVLTARGGKGISRALFLVTDAHILVHSLGRQFRIFVSDVETGEPIAGARVQVWQLGRHPVSIEAKTGADGLAAVDAKESGRLLITASASGGRQAYDEAYTYFNATPGQRDWRVYAFTDRPAYRPGETVQWKILARIRDDNRWTTPQGQSLARPHAGGFHLRARTASRH